ncbi:MAG: hypothetical protein COA86_10260 [Kangiella sp.]|nr:MAG: hypothetical protein COA86_10260 [Kangiella sp.]
MIMKIKQENIIGYIVVLVTSLLLVSCGDIRELENVQMNSSELSEQKLELTSLIVNSSEVLVEEIAGVSEYTVFVKYEAEKIELIASFTKNAKMIINGMESTGKEMLELKPGTNQFEIQIKNGLEMRGYHLVVIRKPN